MTTVTDGVNIVYNRGGTAIVHATTSGPLNDIDVSPVAGRTIILATDSQAGNGPNQPTINISDSFEIGDELMFTWYGPGSFQAKDSNGVIITIGKHNIKVSNTAGPYNNWLSI
jgi:hypothetical protein